MTEFALEHLNPGHGLGSPKVLIKETRLVGI